MKMMKKTLIAAALATVSLPSVAEIAGNVALTTDYRFRGISQTTSDPAVQGGFDWSHDSGFYLGTWGSNVEFAGSLELDYYGGFANNINDNIAYDVGFIYYDYPGGDLGGGVDPEFWEINGGLSGDVGPVSLSGKVSYSNDYFGESGTAFYYDLGASYGLPYDISLNAHFGYQTIDDGAFKDAGFFSSNTDNYKDWSIGVSKSMWDLDFDLSYIDTDLDNDKDYFGDNAVESTVVFSVSKSL
jgi:uncharacterized protein (TIGR02001 family)